MVKGGLDWLVNLGCSFHKTRGWRTGSQRSAEVRLGNEPVSYGNAARMEPGQPQIASGSYRVLHRQGLYDLFADLGPV